MDSRPRRLADGDSVPVDGYPGRWQERINRAALAEPTRDLPTVPPTLIRPYVNGGGHVGRHRLWSA